MRNKRHKRSITKLIFYLFPLLIFSIESLLQIYRKFCSIAVFVWYTLWQQLAEATHTRVKTSTLCVLLSCYEIIILSVWWYLYTFTSHVWCSVVLARNPQCSFQNVRIVRQTVRLYRQRFSFAAQVNCTNNIANFWVKCWYSKLSESILATQKRQPVIACVVYRLTSQSVAALRQSSPGQNLCAHIFWIISSALHAQWMAKQRERERGNELVTTHFYCEKCLCWRNQRAS